MGYSLADPRIMSPVPLPDTLRLDDVISTADSFLGGLLVSHKTIVAIELYKDWTEPPPDVDARIVVVCTANRAPMMVRLVPVAWRIAMKVPGPEASRSIPRLAHLVFEEMARKGEGIRYLMFHQSGFSALLLLKRRDDPGLAKIMKFNRRSLRTLVTGISIMQVDAPPASSP